MPGHSAARRCCLRGAIVADAIAWEPFDTYFYRWALDPEMPAAFDSSATQIARQIEGLPREEEKYVVTPPGASDMLPTPIMFLTGDRDSGRPRTSTTCRASVRPPPTSSA